VQTLNQGERQPIPTAEQVVIIYAATNGYVDRVAEDRVGDFHEQLVARLRAEASDMLEKIAGGDWSDETQARVKEVVAEFADDFGYDLDEDGKPVDTEDDVDDRRRGRDDEESAEERSEEEEPAPAAA
jgi:F-type H+-transporting ATPase subunit alpha